MISQPIDVENAIQLANAYLQSGHMAEAETIYQQVLAVNQNHFNALHGLGIIALNAGKLDRATEFISSAIQQCPFDYNAHNNLGIALMQQGKLNEAVYAFNKALSIKQDYTNATYNLARAHQELGNHGIGLEIMLNARGFVRFTLSKVLLLSTTQGERSKGDNPQKAA
jgi:Flp pilus assembly protein TadD